LRNGAIFIIFGFEKTLLKLSLSSFINCNLSELIKMRYNNNPLKLRLYLKYLRFVIFLFNFSVSSSIFLRISNNFFSSSVSKLFSILFSALNLIVHSVMLKVGSMNDASFPICEIFSIYFCLKI
jgi:hypothetical protein